MAIFPADELSLSAAIRKRLRPLANSYTSHLAEYKKRSDSGSGISRFRDMWGRTRRVASGTMNLSEADGALIEQFWAANRNVTFTFFDFKREQWTDKVIGTGNGVLATYYPPGKDYIGTVIVKVNGVVRTPGTHYNLTNETGPNGEMRIVFTGGNIPPNGHPIAVTALVRGRYTVEYVNEQEIASAGRDRVTVTFSVREAF
jgi:hypothetical protein